MIKNKIIALRTRVDLKEILKTLLVIILIVVSEETLLFGANSNSTYLNVQRVSCIVLLIILGILSLRKGKFNIRTMFTCFLMCAFVLLSKIINQDPTDGFFLICIIIVIGFETTHLLTIEEFAVKFEKIMYFLSFVSVIGMAIFYIYHSFFHIFPVLKNTAGVEFYNAGFFLAITSPQYARNWMIFREPGVAQMFVSLAMIFYITYAKEVKLRRIIVYSLAIILTFSTTGYISLVLILGWYLCRKPKTIRERINKSYIIILAIACLAVVMLFVGLSPLIDLVIGKLFDPENPSMIARRASLITNLEIWLEHPLFGCGITLERSLFPSLSGVRYGMTIVDNTNTLLGMLSTFGIFFTGIVVYGYGKFCSRITKGRVEKLFIIAVLLVLAIGEKLLACPTVYILMFYGIMAPKKAKIVSMEDNSIKKVLQVNICSNGSTGKIMCGIADIAKNNNIGMKIAYPYEKPKRGDTEQIKWISDDVYEIGDAIIRKGNTFLEQLTGFQGCFSVFATIGFLRMVKSYKPDIIHLHNIHRGNLNYGMLFRYIKKHHIRTVWTLHDCWSFTGQCPHFTMVKCEMWKTGCHDCYPSQYRSYPASWVDRTKTMWKLKKKWFTGVEDMTIVTPSQWLADLVKQSFLKDYPVAVINNGIDLNVFKPTESDFEEKYGIEDKIMLLGVAFNWEKRKGLDVFIKLSKRLDPEKYQIVLVGTDDSIDAQLPDNIISIHKTQNQRELAEIYTAADLFVNPTREENYPTVNMEAIACGTPVITFNTGGSPEIINEQTGAVVRNNTVKEIAHIIQKVGKKNVIRSNKCVESAQAFDMNTCFAKYVELYESYNERNV